MRPLIIHYRQLVGIAKSWAAAHVPHWDDEAHRALLAHHGATLKDGRYSATTMSAAQLNEVLKAYETRGWERKQGCNSAGTTRKVSPQIAVIVKRWSTFCDVDKVAPRERRPRLLGFATRQTGRAINRLDDLTPAENQALITAITARLNRARA